MLILNNVFILRDILLHSIMEKTLLAIEIFNYEIEIFKYEGSENVN